MLKKSRTCCPATRRDAVPASRLTWTASVGIRTVQNSPEQASGIGVDARIEVMNLCREVGKVKLTFEEVQSDEAEDALVNVIIHADRRALHEPHIHVEQQVV